MPTFNNSIASINIHTYVHAFTHVCMHKNPKLGKELQGVIVYNSLAVAHLLLCVFPLYRQEKKTLNTLLIMERFSCI